MHARWLVVPFAGVALFGVASCASGQSRSEQVRSAAEASIPGPPVVRLASPPSGLGAKQPVAGDDSVADFASVLYVSRSTGLGLGGPFVVITENGHNTFQDLGLALTVTRSAGRELASGTLAGRPVVAWKDQTSGRRQLLEGSGVSLDRLQQLAGRFATVPGDRRPVLSGEPGWAPAGSADGTNYWATLGPPDGSAPRRSTRVAYVDPQDPQRRLVVTTSPGDRGAGLAMAALLPAHEVLARPAGSTAAYGACRDAVCSAGIAVWQDRTALASVAWTHLRAGEARPALASLVLGATG